jgi:hypothetical protein
MTSIKIVPTVENLVQEIRQLSVAEQRSLASAVLKERTLEAFVEEIEDQLSCERAATEESPEQFKP